MLLGSIKKVTTNLYTYCGFDSSITLLQVIFLLPHIFLNKKRSKYQISQKETKLKVDLIRLVLPHACKLLVLIRKGTEANTK